MVLDKFCLFVLSCCLFYLGADSQNLVPNGSFENYKDKTLFYSGGIKQMENWYAPNKGTPDIFSLNNRYYFPATQNKMGAQKPQDKQTYSCIGFEYGLGYEYLTTKLSSPLNTNGLYCISFYLSLADKSNFIADGVGIELSIDDPKKKIARQSKFEIGLGYKYEFYKSAQSIITDSVICNDSEWMSYSFIYKAAGNEQYLTIGLFKPFDEMNYYNKRSCKKLKFVKFGFCTYFIDNVSITEISDSSECPSYKEKHKFDKILVLNKDTIKTGENIILENILFETGSSILLDVSKPELDKAATFMKEHPEYNAEIHGHTDNIGDSAMNMILSEDRAQSVVEYLISQGVDKNRLSSKGFGCSKPLVPNDSDENRQKNRRVEIVFLLRE